MHIRVLITVAYSCYHRRGAVKAPVLLPFEFSCNEINLMSECEDVCTALSLKTPNALDALVSLPRKQVGLYVLSRRLKQSVLFVGSRIKPGRELQATGPVTEN